MKDLLIVLGVTAALALGIAGFNRYQEGLREQGRAEVRTEWAAADARREADERAALIKRQAAERTEEQRMARAAEEKSIEQARTEKALRDRAAAAERVAVGLRNTIARLDADSRARRAEGTCAAAEREADDAARARELFSACAGRYRELGKASGELAGQVIGLQDHVVVVQPEAAALLAPVED